MSEKLKLPEWYKPANYAFNNIDLFDIFINYKRRCDLIKVVFDDAKPTTLNEYLNTKFKCNEIHLVKIATHRLFKKIIDSPLQATSKIERENFYKYKDYSSLANLGISEKINDFLIAKGIKEKPSNNDFVKIVSYEDLVMELLNLDDIINKSYNLSNDEIKLFNLEKKILFVENEEEFNTLFDEINILKKKKVKSIINEPISNYKNNNQIQIEIDLRYQKSPIIERLKSLITKLKKTNHISTKVKPISKDFTKFSNHKIFDFFDLKYWYHINGMEVNSLELYKTLLPDNYDLDNYGKKKYNTNHKRHIDHLNKYFSKTYLLELETSIISQKSIFK